MGDLAEEVYDRMLDDEANGEVCPIHGIWYNARITCCWKCENGIDVPEED